jgi:cytoskeletal protein RodZ
MPRIVETDLEARQGPKGRPVLMVLIGAFALIGLYLLSMLFWAGSTSPDSTSQDASRTAVTGSPTCLTNQTARTPPANPAYPVRNDMTTGSTTPSGTTDNSLHQPKKE